MKQYTIYCTEEQTRKARELGAQITESPMMEIIRNEIGEHCYRQDYSVFWFPTAEQMLGFFRSKNIHIVIHKDTVDGWSVYGHEISPIEFTVFDRIVGFNSYEEAVIAAIDVALEYLNNRSDYE